MKIAGLDIGTTGCKCTVFDSDGTYLDKAYKEYPKTRLASGHEIDAFVLRECVFEVIRIMAKKYPDIAGLGVTSFGETFVLVDEEGNPLMNSMLYTDPRGHDECRELIDKLGEMNIAKITGLRPHEMYGLPKLMWVKNHRPEVFNKTKYVLQVVDFIVYSLSGVAQEDYSLATRTLAFDLDTLDWNSQLLAAAGIDSSIYPKPVPSGTSAGKILPKMAELTGLSEDTVIVSISQDQVAAAVGAGAFDAKTAVDGSGTVECMTLIYDEKPDPKELYKGYFVTVPYIISGKYVTYAFMYTGGALIKWCTDNLTGKSLSGSTNPSAVNPPTESVNDALERRFSEIMKAIGRDEKDPTGLMILPHFAGAATPYMDTGSKGAIVGLTVDTDISEIYMACLEGICYEMYLLYNKIKDTGIKFDCFHATGGGARSKVFMQMKADMLGVPFVALSQTDSGTVGSAMMTGVAIGIYKDIFEAAEIMIKTADKYEPDIKRHEKFMEVFKRYEKLYDAVRPLV